MGSSIEYHNLWTGVNVDGCKTSFFRPYLCLEHDPNEPNTFAPAHNNIKYLVIRVRNIGRSTAYNCNADVKVMIPPNIDRMNYPSDNCKILGWSREHDLSDLSSNRNIRAHHWDLLHVVFSHPAFPNIPSAAPTRYASFSIPDRLNNNGLSVPDSFTEGVYDIEIRVTADQTHMKGRFRIYVHTNHMSLNMISLPYSTREKFKQRLRIAI